MLRTSFGMVTWLRDCLAAGLASRLGCDAGCGGYEGLSRGENPRHLTCALVYCAHDNRTRDSADAADSFITIEASGKTACLPGYVYGQLKKLPTHQMKTYRAWTLVQEGTRS